MNDPSSTTSKELERYAELLDEARRIKGVSLGRDAWRRLRRNHVAMLSLSFLMLISLLAVLTPFWPLQSPIEQNLSNEGQFQTPGARSTVAIRVDTLRRPCRDAPHGAKGNFHE